MVEVADFKTGEAPVDEDSGERRLATLPPAAAPEEDAGSTVAVLAVPVAVQPGLRSAV